MCLEGKLLPSCFFLDYFLLVFSDVLCWPGSSTIKVIGLLGLLPEQSRWTLYLWMLHLFCHLTMIFFWVPVMFKQHNGWERGSAAAVVKLKSVKMGQSMEVGVAVDYIWRFGIHTFLLILALLCWWLAIPGVFILPINVKCKCKIYLICSKLGW